MTNNAPWNKELPTLRDIQKIIPSHLFLPDHKKGFLLYSQTVLLFVLLFLFALYIIPELSSPFKQLAWLFYWFFQGTIFWSFFGWGHDCGHNGFSKHKWVNTLVGNITHSFILMPYESWKTTHKLHHMNTGNIDKDVNYPPKRSKKLIKRHWIVGLLGIAHFLYLCGLSTYRINHFNPFGDVFKNNRRDVIISLLVWFVFFCAVIASIFIFGLINVLAFYGIPLFGYATWLVISSFLNHADPKVPWWGNKTWTYMKGNIFSVIDVSYGRFLDYLVQDNGLHQIHHLFPHVPTYHMKEATAHFRRHFPHLAKDRTMAVWPAFWEYLKNFREQKVLHDDVDVFFYDDGKGQESIEEEYLAKG